MYPCNTHTPTVKGEKSLGDTECTRGLSPTSASPKVEGCHDGASNQGKHNTEPMVSRLYDIDSISQRKAEAPE